MMLINAGLTLMVCLLILYYIVQSLKIVPKMHIAIPEIWGERQKKVLYEGWHFTPWGIEALTLYSLENNMRRVVVKVKSKDKVTVILDGSYEWIPDKDNMFVFMENSKSLDQGAVDNSIMSALGVIAGTRDALDFIQYREAILVFINCLLRLEKMPHDYPKMIGLKMDPIEDNDEILEFYKDNARTIRLKLLAKESEWTKKKSKIERQYGIDIKTYDLTVPDFDEAFNKAIQRDKETKALVEASERELDLARKYEGISQKAINAAQSTIGKAKRKIHSIEGEPIRIQLGGEK